jgi:hypothetical protein
MSPCHSSKEGTSSDYVNSYTVHNNEFPSTHSVSKYRCCQICVGGCVSAIVNRLILLTAQVIVFRLRQENLKKIGIESAKTLRFLLFLIKSKLRTMKVSSTHSLLLPMHSVDFLANLYKNLHKRIIVTNLNSKNIYTTDQSSLTKNTHVKTHM